MRRPDIRLLTLAALLPWAAMAEDAPSAASPVPLDTRAGQHDGYGRLVFAGVRGGHPVGLTAETQGTTLIIHFQAPVSPYLDPLRRSLRAYLDGVSLSADGTTLTASLKRPITLHQSRTDADTQVIDLVDQPTPKPDVPKSDAPKPDTPASVPLPATKPPSPIASSSAPVPASPAPAVQPPAASVAPAALPATAVTGSFGRSADNGLQIRYTATDSGISIRFQWASPAAAAIFQRGGAIWIVFDRPQKLDFANFRPIGANPGGSAALAGIAQIPSRSGTALRLKMQGDLFPSVRRAGNDWIVEIGPQAAYPSAALKPSVQDDGGNAALVFAALDPGTPISLVDPDAGDTLVAVPLPGLGQGVDASIDYPDLVVLPSVQGLVFRPKSDQLAIRQLTGQVEVSAPGGLTLSPDGERVLAPRPPKLTGSLLNPGDWVGPANTHFLVREPVLLAGVAQAEPAARTNARLDLAKFYFANGDDAEALGVLRVAEGTVPNLTDDPVVRLMQGAAEVTIGQLDGAASDLSDHALDGRVDTALWRSVLAAAKGDWVEAGTLAAQGLPALKTYPPVLRRKVAVPVAEALFRRGDKADAEALAQDVLKSDPTRGQRDYASVLLGRIAAEKGDVAEAEKLWQSAAVSPEIDLGRAQGAYALAVTQLDKKEIARPDAIAAIDRLRYAWRGDDFEIMVLRKLADLYAEDSDYRMAFETLQRIPAGFPDTPAARDATAQMQKTFADIFLGPTADTLPPLTALALYDEFKELTPAGAQGDAIVRKLADRLVSVDLLDRAGNLLDEQVKTRLSGIDQARVATQLALVRLMDNRPADAVAALDVPVAGDLPEDLQRQRAELRARALSQSDKPDDALKLLAGDDSADADRLRGDIALKTQNWAALAALLQKGLKDPGADGRLDAETSSTVVRVATAMALGHDKAGMDALNRKYGAAMEASPDRDAFRVVAGSGAGASDAARSLADRVAQIGDLQSFMSSYRQRVQQAKLSAIN